MREAGVHKIFLYRSRVRQLLQRLFQNSENFIYEQSVTHGPIRTLWLDYSQVTGTLNQMQVSEPDGNANVCLLWETF